jgi:CTP synthase
LVPFIHAAKEMKTKPTQHSVKELREIGIQPDILMCRCEGPLSRSVREKIGLFCNVKADEVIEARDVESIYEVPIMLESNGLGRLLVEKLRLVAANPELGEWEAFVRRVKSPSKTVRIGICGKYVELRDAYKSIIEAFIHAGALNDARVETEWISADDLKDGQGIAGLDQIHGLLVPGGFGERGIEGKLKAIQYVREKGIPFFGICLGLQCAVIEFARHVGGMEGANSREFNAETPYPVIDFQPGQKDIQRMGGTMRLGAYPCDISEGSLVFQIYGQNRVHERHRHRFEVNNEYRAQLGRAGMRFSGICPEGDLVEVIELPGHPWFIGVQYHPELRSRAASPHPLFVAFVRAAVRHSEGQRG